jgi:hypothetical protein
MATSAVVKKPLIVMQDTNATRWLGIMQLYMRTTQLESCLREYFRAVDNQMELTNDAYKAVSEMRAVLEDFEYLTKVLQGQHMGTAYLYPLIEAIYRKVSAPNQVYEVTYGTGIVSQVRADQMTAAPKRFLQLIPAELKLKFFNETCPSRACRMAMFFDPCQKGTLMNNEQYKKTIDEVKNMLDTSYKKFRVEPAPAAAPEQAQPPQKRARFSGFHRPVAQAAQEAREQVCGVSSRSSIEAYIAEDNYGKPADRQDDSADTKASKIYQRLQNPRIDRLGYWRKKKADWPDLARLAARYLGMPASTALLENNFSACGVQDQSKRHLEPKLMKKLGLASTNRQHLSRVKVNGISAYVRIRGAFEDPTLDPAAQSD